MRYITNPTCWWQLIIGYDDLFVRQACESGPVNARTYELKAHVCLPFGLKIYHAGGWQLAVSNQLYSVVTSAALSAWSWIITSSSSPWYGESKLPSTSLLIPMYRFFGLSVPG